MKTPRKEEIADWQLPDECLACGTEGSYLHEPTESTKTIRGETFTVPHHHWKCQDCGSGILGDADMDEAMAAVTAAYQSANELLTGSEIRSARARQKWSQQELANRSGISLATIKRLELSNTIQTETNDKCLRDCLGAAIDGAFVFMKFEMLGVGTTLQTEQWDSGLASVTSVSTQEVAMDFHLDEICFQP